MGRAIGYEVLLFDFSRVIQVTLLRCDLLNLHIGYQKIWTWIIISLVLLSIGSTISEIPYRNRVIYKMFIMKLVMDPSAEV